MSGHRPGAPTVYGLRVIRDPLPDETLGAYVVACGVVHFTESELLTLARAGLTAQLPPRAWWSRMIPTLAIAEELRRRMGCPLNVGNGYRPEPLNSQVGGHPRSQHLHFRALDLDLPRGSSRARRLRYADTAYAIWGEVGHTVAMGIGFYSSPGAGRVHIDTGHRRRSWKSKHVKRIAGRVDL